MPATTQHTLSNSADSGSRVDQMYTVGHAARTAEAIGVRPSVLLRAFLSPLEDGGRLEGQRTA